MTDTTAPLRVIYRRDPCGAVASLEIHAGDALFLDTAAGDNPGAALDHLLGVARDYYRADPHADHLPPDEAVIAAYWDHLA
jgi:hypothetical protein